jgi:hypothetical protein
MATTTDREKTVLRELASFYSARVVPTLATLRACVFAARLTSEILTEFEIPHEIAHVDVLVVNDEWWEYCVEKGISDVAHVPDTVWSVSCYSNEKPEKNGFPGHLVVETDDFLVDLSSGQFDRPQHKILTNSPLVAPMGSLLELHDDWWSVPILEGRYLFRNAAVPRMPSRGSPDWSRTCWSSITECEKVIRRALDE